MMRELTEMELRVASALDARIEGWFGDRTEANLNTVDLARAAIRAMREPTKEMCEAGSRYLQSAGYLGTDPEGVAKFTSQTMIDAASPSQ